jgi:hypothetical protein
MAVLEVPALLGGLVCNELSQLMQPAPVLAAEDGRWLFFANPANVWPRGSAHTALLLAGAVLHEQFSRIVLPCSNPGALAWVVEPEEDAELPRLSVVCRATRKAFAAQSDSSAASLTAIADAPDDQRITVVFAGHGPLPYRISRKVASEAADDLTKHYPDARVSIDAGPLHGLRRYPSEPLWFWRV